jgi:hypothetical protein
MAHTVKSAHKNHATTVLEMQNPKLTTPVPSSLGTCM